MSASQQDGKSSKLKLKRDQSSGKPPVTADLPVQVLEEAGVEANPEQRRFLSSVQRAEVGAVVVNFAPVPDESIANLADAAGFHAAARQAPTAMTVEGPGTSTMVACSSVTAMHFKVETSPTTFLGSRTSSRAKKPRIESTAVLEDQDVEGVHDDGDAHDSDYALSVSEPSDDDDDDSDDYMEEEDDTPVKRKGKTAQKSTGKASSKNSRQAKPSAQQTRPRSGSSRNSGAKSHLSPPASRAMPPPLPVGSGKRKTGAVAVPTKPRTSVGRPSVSASRQTASVGSVAAVADIGASAVAAPTAGASGGTIGVTPKGRRDSNAAVSSVKPLAGSSGANIKSASGVSSNGAASQASTKAAPSTKPTASTNAPPPTKPTASTNAPPPTKPTASANAPPPTKPTASTNAPPPTKPTASANAPPPTTTTAPTAAPPSNKATAPAKAAAVANAVPSTKAPPASVVAALSSSLNEAAAHTRFAVKAAPRAEVSAYSALPAKTKVATQRAVASTGNHLSNAPGASKTLKLPTPSMNGGMFFGGTAFRVPGLRRPGAKRPAPS